jgi:glycosyltransferase involved in cell wall biosynthesis
MLRRTVSGLLRALEQTSARALSAVVAATETIAVKFPPDRTAVVRNYPLANRQLAFANRKAGRLRVVHLAATLTEDRGITALVQAMGLLDDDIELVLAGRFIPPDYEARLAALPGWRRVRHIPSLPHEQVWDCYAGCDAGAVCLAPLPRYRVSLPVKLFEFMAAGLPVVASDFPLFRRIVEDSDSGICVDPTDPEQIAGAFRFLAEHRVVAAAMAENGRQAVRNQYNWDHEAATLLRTYARLTSRRELGNRRSRFAAGPADAAGTAPGTPAGDQTHV